MVSTRCCGLAYFNNPCNQRLLHPLETVVPESVPVVVVLAVWRNKLPVVSSFDQHDQPLGAVAPVAPLIVITAVQAPVVPEVNCPAAPPPTGEVAKHPETVNVVPVDIIVSIWLPPTARIA